MITKIVTGLKAFIYQAAFSCAMLLFACLSNSARVNAEDAIEFDKQEVTDRQIKQLFPKATSISSRDENQHVWAAYQLQELLGYAFESNDFVDLKGFSGDRINVLVGLGMDGKIAGLELLQHHEPIFMHGLGPKPFLGFLQQYTGLSLRDQVLLNGRRDAEKPGTRVFDGITKATVSVIVANDTVLSASREVARIALPDFAQQAPSEVRSDYYQPKTLEQLVEGGLLNFWQIRRDELEDKLGASLDEYPEFTELTDNLADNNGLALEIYYAYLNTPITGRNLLGDTEYQRLQESLGPGEHAIAVFSRGILDFIEPEFRPGSIPERLRLRQHDLAVTVRDMNYFSARDAQPDGHDDFPIPVANLRIFRIRAQAGFDPASPFQLELNIRMNRNPLVSDSAHFSNRLQLPGELFTRVESLAQTEQALWRKIWWGRKFEITVLLLSLALLSGIFVSQRRLRKYPRVLPRLRTAFLLFTLMFIGFYSQGQLSVVNIYTLLLSLREGFELNVFLLDPVIFILWLYTFASLFIWGRGLFCGWLCPFGALQEFLSRLAVYLRLPQWRVPPLWHRRMLFLKYPLLMILVGTAGISLAGAEKMAELEPFKTAITLGFVREWPFVVYAVILLGCGLFVHKFYCRYLCPLGAGLAILGRFRRFEWLDRRQECGSPCQLCRHRCQIGAIDRRGQIDYDECIQCLDCVVILEDPAQCAPVRVSQRRRLNMTGPQTKTGI